MIITLTPNTGIDHTVQISQFQLNHTIRASTSAWGMGGKATDVSWILGKLGVPTRALGFAAGANGARMENMLRERGVETDFVQVAGETRLNTVIVVPGEGQSTITTSSLEVAADQLADLLTRLETALDQGASCVVMGGSLPAGVPVDFYTTAIARAQRQHVPVIFDSSGASFVAGVKSAPDLIKPNLTELSDLLGYTPGSVEEIKAAARKVHDEIGSGVIVTLGGEGAIAIFERVSYFIHPVSVPLASSAGAGDGVLAGMALALFRRESYEWGLRHGFALAAAVLMTLPTADLRVEDYQALLPQIRIEEL
ncbi:MAG TPA: hexose kinase [Anaerolineales bacterium]|nr:hexose kinase [Anaerolineales bacterium]